MSNPHDADAPKPENNAADTPPGQPPTAGSEDFDFLDEGDIVFDLAEEVEDSAPMRTLNLSEVPEEPKSAPMSLDEAQSMVFEAEELTEQDVADGDGLVAFDLPEMAEEVAEIDFAEPASEVEDTEGMIAFDMPDLDDSEAGTRTQGMARDELDFLMEEAAKAQPVSLPAVPEAESEIVEELEAADFGEAVPFAEAASFAGSGIPDAEPASSSSLAFAENVDVGEAVPFAESASSTSGVVPEAEAIESAAPIEPMTVAESPFWSDAGSTKPDIDLSSELEPVQPAASWFHSQPSPAEPAAAELQALDAKAMESDDIFDIAQIPVADGSDIFSWKPSGTGSSPSADLPPVAKATPSALIRESAAISSRHKGASTPIDDEEIDTGSTPRASVDASSILNELGGPLASNIDGSEVLLQNPGVDRTLSDEDEAIPEFAGLDDLPSFDPADDPAIELQAESLEDDANVSSMPPFGEPAEAGAGSQVPFDVQPTPASDDASPDWFDSPGSDLFVGQRGSPSEKLDASGLVNPFANDIEAEDPSLSSSPSSIFSGLQPPMEGSYAGGSASVRIGNNQDEQTIFNQTADDDQASDLFSGAFTAAKKPNPASDSTQEDEEEGQVDWLASDPSEVDSALHDLRNAPDAGIFSRSSLPEIGKGPSSIFSKTQLDPSSEDRQLEATREIDSKGDLIDDLYGDLPAMASPPEPSKSGGTTTPHAGVSPEVEVDWLANAEESESLRSSPAAAFAMVGDDDAPPRARRRGDDSSVDDNILDDFDDRPTPRTRPERAKTQRGGSGMLVGGLAGMLGGLAVGAGVYFSGLVPNSEKLEAPPVQVAKAEPKKDALIAQIKEELAAEKTASEKKIQEVTERAEKSSQELARVQEDKVGFEIAAKMAEERAKTLEKDAETAKANVKTADQTAKDALAKVTDLEKASKDALAKVTDLEKAAVEAADKLTKAETDAKANTDTLAGITKNLQENKLLPAEMADAAAVAVAVKDAIAKAAKPGTAMPAGSLTAAEAATLKELVAKSDASAKGAAEKLATDTATLKTDYLAQMDTLKKGHADEIKKLTDGSPDLKKFQEAADAALKKAKDEAVAKLETETASLKKDYLVQIDTLKKSHSDEIKKLSEGTPELKKILDAASAELKKAQDAGALAVKELNDKLTADSAKLKAEYDAKLLAAEKKATDDVAKSQAELAAAKADLTAVMTPAQALDLWLPVLTEARRPADADAAAANADKVLASAAPGTEAFAKAQTVKGLALLIKGNLDGARNAFDVARKDPTYAAAKPWSKTVDEGMQSLTDPLAKFRKPVDPERKDPRVAVRFLDEGIRLYSNRRYPEAEKFLNQAALHDSTNPVTWYYLGAARWQIGRRDEAKADFQQGAEREMLRSMSASQVEQAIASIQGPVRGAISDARP